MNATVLKIKDNLDTLMISFRKELHLKQDDYESEVDPSIEEIKTFKDLIDEAVEKAEFFRNYGTPIQLFIHLQKIKDEIKEAIDEQFKLTLTAQKLESQLIINDVVEQLEKLTCLGQVRMLKKEDPTIKTFNSTINGTFCKVPCFDSIRIVKEKIIEIGEDVRGGTSSCVDSIVLIAIFSGKIIALDLLSEQKIATFPCHTPKRLTYSEASSFLYISCYSGYLYRVKYDTIYGFSDSLTIKSSVPFNGGVCCNGTNFFTIVENGIYKDDNMVNQVYRTNTSCANNLNGLAYDRRNNRFIYTSKDNEIVCISEDGAVIFTYKDKSMKTISSVAIGPNGIIFAGDESGFVYVISEDGKRGKTLIDTFGSVNDVWVDKEFKSLFVCGNKSVAKFRIE